MRFQVSLSINLLEHWWINCESLELTVHNGESYICFGWMRKCYLVAQSVPLTFKKTKFVNVTKNNSGLLLIQVVLVSKYDLKLAPNYFN